jgi:hypothetical protein
LAELKPPVIMLDQTPPALAAQTNLFTSAQGEDPLDIL